MEIIFKGLHTDVAARFRDQAVAKLSKLEKLDQKAIRVDVEVSVERNPRQASQKERVELTIVSRGPAIRAEAAAEDRFAALDLALAKLDSRLRRAMDRRKRHHAGHGPDRTADRAGPGQLLVSGYAELPDGTGSDGPAPRQAAAGGAQPPAETVVPIDMDGDGPLVVRQKLHHATPITIDQALLEMELVGHDFYLFCDADSKLPSVVYRRRGYQYGVIRLIDDSTRRSGESPAVADGREPAEAGVAPDASQLARPSRQASAPRSG